MEAFFHPQLHDVAQVFLVLGFQPPVIAVSHGEHFTGQGRDSAEESLTDAFQF